MMNCLIVCSVDISEMLYDIAQNRVWSLFFSVNPNLHGTSSLYDAKTR
jgi:hypothetical protein